jgi:hypothetical protein
VLAGLWGERLGKDLESLNEFGYIAEATKHIKGGIESGGGKRRQHAGAL